MSILTTALFLIDLWSVQALAQATLVELEQQAMTAAVARVAPCVVRIETIGGLERVEELVVPTGPTTGLIVSEDGYIVSSAFNFVQKPSSILVTLHDGSRHAATIVAHDRSRMLVLLKITAPFPLAVPQPAPRDSWQVGQWVIAVGRTFPGNAPNVAIGILSATNRIWGKAVQTDAKVSPTNYGGPLVDIEGRVIGILVPISPHAQDEIAGAEWYDSGIGFAIPLVDVLGRLDQWRQGQDLHPGLLGIVFRDRNELLGEPVVSMVRVNSPAAKAGLLPNDRITHVNGVPVGRIAEVKHVLGPLYAGDTVEVTVLRDGQPVRLTTTLVDQLIPYAHATLGLSVRSSGVQPANLEIDWVLPGGPAHQAGIRVGDRIETCAGQPVPDEPTLRQILLARQPGETITLQALRGGDRLTVDVLLGALPETVPEHVPIQAPVAGPPAVMVPVKVPEEANECQFWLPEGFDGQRPFALVVWLQPGGQYDPQAVVGLWKDVCIRYRIALLLPRSADPTGWRPTDVNYLRKAISQVLQDYAIDRQRVVVGGQELGGSTAFLVAFAARDMVRGLLVKNAGTPVRLQIPDNEPQYRLAVLLTAPGMGRLHATMLRVAEQLRKLRYPTTVQISHSPDLSADELETIGKWIFLLGLL